MNNIPNIPYPVVTNDGVPTHVMVPIDAYLQLQNEAGQEIDYVYVPLEVGKAVLMGASPLRAWREHLKLTQEEVAQRMKVSRPAYTQMEKSRTPHIATIKKASKAFGVEAEQIMELYEESPIQALH